MQNHTQMVIVGVRKIGVHHLHRAQDLFRSEGRPPLFSYGTHAFCAPICQTRTWIDHPTGPGNRDTLPAIFTNQERVRRQRTQRYSSLFLLIVREPSRNLVQDLLAHSRLLSPFHTLLQSPAVEKKLSRSHQQVPVAREEADWFPCGNQLDPIARYGMQLGSDPL